MEIDVKKLQNFMNEASNKLNTIVSALDDYSTKLQNVISTIYMSDFAKALSSFANKIKEAKQNPNSFINYENYRKQLDGMHWAWPYNITAEELRYILESVNNEKEFDNQMNLYFTNEKVNQMLDIIINKVSYHHKILIKQVKNAFNRKDYAIANSALLSIIDNTLSLYLKNKGQTKRVGIFNPILEYFDEYPLDEIPFIFELCMLSANIDFIFESYNFAEKIDINTNKKVRRHPYMHGVKYSNKRIDTVMLINTLINLVVFQDVLKRFRNSLIVNKEKRFVFLPKIQKQMDEQIVIDYILAVIELDKFLDHSKIVELLEQTDLLSVDDPKRYVTCLLQKMKRKNLIKNKKIDGKIYWFINECNEK